MSTLTVLSFDPETTMFEACASAQQSTGPVCPLNSASSSPVEEFHICNLAESCFTFKNSYSSPFCIILLL